jgi:hypothetical protein
VTGGAITVSATITDTNALTSVKATVFNNGASFHTLTLTNGGSGNVYTGSFTAPANVSGTNDTFTASIKAIDSAALSSTVTATGSSLEPADTSAQISATLSPTTLPIAGGAITVSAIITAPAGVSSAKATLLRNGVLVSTLTLSNGGSGSNYSASYNAPPNVSGTAYTFTSNITVKDNAGFTTTVSATGSTTQASDTLPAVSGSVNPSSIAIGGGPVSITVNATGTLPITGVKVTIGNNSSPTFASISLSNGGSGSVYTGTFNAPPNSGTVTQNYTFTATAKDTLGQSGSALLGSVTQSPNFTPTVTASSISPSSVPITGGQITVSATISNGAPLKTVKASILNNGVVVSTITLTNGGSGSTYTGVYNAQPNVSGTAITYTSNVTVVDILSQTSTTLVSGSCAQATDTAPAVSASITPANLAWQGGLITISASVTTPVSVHGVKANIVLNGTVVGTITLKNTSGNVYSATYNAPPNKTSTANTYTATITAQDSLNLISTTPATGTSVVAPEIIVN